MVTESYGDTIKRLRRSLNLSQIQLADEIDCTASHVSSVEGHRWRFGRETEAKFARLAGVSLEFIAAAPLGPCEASDAACPETRR